MRWPSVLEREAAKRAYREEVMAALKPVVEMQLSQALGRLATVVVVELGDGGKFTLRKVTDETELADLAVSGNRYRVVLSEPDGMMSRYLTDQAIGRPDAPATTTTVTTATGAVTITHEHHS